MSRCRLDHDRAHRLGKIDEARQQRRHEDDIRRGDVRPQRALGPRALDHAVTASCMRSSRALDLPHAGAHLHQPRVIDVHRRQPVDEGDDRIPPRRRLRGGGGHLGGAVRHPRAEAQHEGVAVGEVAIQRADAHAGAVGDHAHRGDDALLGEHLAGGIEQALSVRRARRISAVARLFDTHRARVTRPRHHEGRGDGDAERGGCRRGGCRSIRPFVVQRSISRCCR